MCWLLVAALYLPVTSLISYSVAWVEQGVVLMGSPIPRKNNSTCCIKCMFTSMLSVVMLITEGRFDFHACIQQLANGTYIL